MKIVHINNTAGVASIVANQQKKHGDNADVFVFNKIIYKQFGGNKFNYYSPLSRWKFFRKLKNYDIWHYHHPYGSLKISLEKQNKNKIYLKHYHGDELRGRYDNDFCLVSTPDLLQYAPLGRWLPNPIDIDAIELISKKNYNEQQKQEPQLHNSNDNRIINIAHYPYYKNYRSDDHYSDVLIKLQNERKCKIVTILNLSHEQTLKTMASCDLVIGKILPDIGWFGKFELEGMAMGKPVIAYISDDLYEKYKPPIYRTTKDTFKHDLECLLEDDAERDRLSREGQTYVRGVHSIQSTINTIYECYNKLMR